MPKTIFENSEIEVVCPDCGHKSQKKISWLRANGEFACAGCANHRFKSDDVIAAVDGGQKAIDKFKRRISKIGKKIR